jgi:pyridinium-3,5-biscarboxylic acid mononucleotide sulfurtransferase
VGNTTSPALTGATNELRRHLAGVERLGVAFSGGVDSAVLLALAARVLGADRVVALLGVSPSLAARERTAAHEVARVIGVPVVEVTTYEGDDPAYRANGVDRCFHCKDELFTRIDAEVVREHELDAVAYGENADDARRIDRPGARAATEHRVLRPLADLGLTKAAVRELARELELPCADKPAAPCLASRIPHFAEVTPEKLQQIDRAEAALADLGLREFRVRHHGDLARVELAADELARSGELAGRVQDAVRQAGFAEVIIDPAGLQSGAFTLTVLEGRRG